MAGAGVSLIHEGLTSLDHLRRDELKALHVLLVTGGVEDAGDRDLHVLDLALLLELGHGVVHDRQAGLADQLLVHLHRRARVVADQRCIEAYVGFTLKVSALSHCIDALLIELLDTGGCMGLA